jgi:hypothetical protein
MSQENVGMVRQPMAVATQSRRRLEERLGLRFPGVMAFLTRLLWRLPRRSRLRQAVLRRLVQLGHEALNRGDLEVAFARYDPHVELVSDSRSSDSASTACIAVVRSAFASSSAGLPSGPISGLSLKN